MISEILSLYFKGKHCVGITALTVCYIVWYWYIQLCWYNSIDCVCYIVWYWYIQLCWYNSIDCMLHCVVLVHTVVTL